MAKDSDMAKKKSILDCHSYSSTVACHRAQPMAILLMFLKPSSLSFPNDFYLFFKKVPFLKFKSIAFGSKPELLAALEPLGNRVSIVTMAIEPRS